MKQEVPSLRRSVAHGFHAVLQGAVLIDRLSLIQQVLPGGGMPGFVFLSQNRQFLAGLVHPDARVYLNKKLQIVGPQVHGLLDQAIQNIGTGGIKFIET